MKSMSKKHRIKEDEGLSGLNISSEYAKKFIQLPIGARVTLKDDKSGANTKLIIRATESEVYYVRPEGDIIPELPHQKKTDYVIVCIGSKQQISFVEMKGQNILSSTNQSPYSQILDTINYFVQTEGLKGLLSVQVDKHAFIVSPLKHKVPSGIDSAERKLLKQLMLGSAKGHKPYEYLHYVRYIPNARYSDREGHIICSSIEPLEFPYKQNNQN